MLEQDKKPACIGLARYEPIPDTPLNVAKTPLTTPPREDWKYLKQERKAKD